MVIGRWSTDLSLFNFHDHLQAEVEEDDFGISVLPDLLFGFVQFHDRKDLPGLLQELKDIIPYSFEMHGKFHYIDEGGSEPSIPYEEILPVLRDSGFDDYLICEYEDELFCGGTEFTRRQLALEKKILGL